jgi:hypothetical protein
MCHSWKKLAYCSILGDISILGETFHWNPQFQFPTARAIEKLINSVKKIFSEQSQDFTGIRRQFGRKVLKVSESGKGIPRYIQYLDVTICCCTNANQFKRIWGNEYKKLSCTGKNVRSNCASNRRFAPFEDLKSC